ncbi:MAG: hypothetical protein ACE5J5_05380 [Candidatus Hydrothermarchaeales archaeon]
MLVTATVVTSVEVSTAFDGNNSTIAQMMHFLWLFSIGSVVGYI